MVGSSEIIVIVIVILVLFGGSAIPKFARSLGQAKKEFNAGMKEAEKEEAEKKADAENQRQ
jgi:sec-independent protein translocase protein TatA